MARPHRSTTSRAESRLADMQGRATGARSRPNLGRRPQHSGSARTQRWPRRLPSGCAHGRDRVPHNDGGCRAHRASRVVVRSLGPNSRGRALRHQLTAGLADTSQANLRARPSRLCSLRWKAHRPYRSDRPGQHPLGARRAPASTRSASSPILTSALAASSSPRSSRMHRPSKRRSRSRGTSTLRCGDAPSRSSARSR